MGPIETDHIAVQHWVGNDAFHQLRISLRFAQAAGTWHLLVKAVLRSIRQTQQHWRQANARRSSQYPSLLSGAIAGPGSGPAHDSMLALSIGHFVTSYPSVCGR